ncbi:DUF3231 family protein [Bacillaceae bacterium W0354]
MTKEIKNTSLQAAEMGKFWSIYVGNTMGKCVMQHCYKHCDDEEVKSIIKQALGLSEYIIKNTTKIFEESHFPIPQGFNENDVNLEAPRLFHDNFYLYYLQYTGKAGLSIYNAGIAMVTRKDVREFLVTTLQSTVQLITDVNDLLQKKGLLMEPPKIQTPQKVDFVKKQSYLTGFLGDRRPLHGLEIAHLFDNINNDTTSKAIITGFSQGAKNKRVKNYLLRGQEINHKHIQAAMKKLNDDHLPSPSLKDHYVTDSTVAPFSDKLMMFHKIDMFSMKIRTYANGASLNGRRDIGAMYAKFLLDVSLYVEDGANIMIDHGWMEQPPEAINRDKIM